MAQLSDSIERFIKELMEEGSQIEVRRNELAQHFGCAPSQINYVLATRFSVDHGYIIESKRVGNSIPEENACAIIAHLLDRKLVTSNEAKLMRAAVSRNALALPVSAKDVLRASVLKNMLEQVFRNLEGGERHDV